MSESPDLLVVGAGPTGCVIAREAAVRRGWRSIVIDRRPHIAGLCHDYAHESGVLVQAFGPHCFRTNRLELVQWLSQFTDWIEGRYVVRSQVNGRLYPFPINLTTLEMVFDRELDEESAAALLESVREPIDSPANAREWVCSRVGTKIYEMFYRGYTIKQWGVEPDELDASVCGRVPIRLNRAESYVDQLYQVMPREGFTRMLGNMLDHPLIETRLETDYRSARQDITPKLATIYCGAVDEYFDHSLGRLPWRSLKFELRHYDQEYVQPCAQINYPDCHEYTRSVEFKYLTGQQHDETVVLYEYPRKEGEPYYPVLSEESQALYGAYRRLAEREAEENHVYMAGRLGRFCYINSDEAMDLAFELFETLSRRYR